MHSQFVGGPLSEIPRLKKKEWDDEAKLSKPWGPSLRPYNEATETAKFGNVKKFSQQEVKKRFQKYSKIHKTVRNRIQQYNKQEKAKQKIAIRVVETFCTISMTNC